MELIEGIKKGPAEAGTVREQGLSLSGCYGGNCYRKPKTVRGRESGCPELYSETLVQVLRSAAGENFSQCTKV